MLTKVTAALGAREGPRMDKLRSYLVNTRVLFLGMLL